MASALVRVALYKAHAQQAVEHAVSAGMQTLDHAVMHAWDGHSQQQAFERLRCVLLGDVNFGSPSAQFHARSLHHCLSDPKACAPLLADAIKHPSLAQAVATLALQHEGCPMLRRLHLASDDDFAQAVWCAASEHRARALARPGSAMVPVDGNTARLDVLALVCMDNPHARARGWCSDTSRDALRLHRVVHMHAELLCHVDSSRQALRGSGVLVAAAVASLLCTRTSVPRGSSTNRQASERALPLSAPDAWEHLLQSDGTDGQAGSGSCRMAAAMPWTDWCHAHTPVLLPSAMASLVTMVRPMGTEASSPDGDRVAQTARHRLWRLIAIELATNVVDVPSMDARERATRTYNEWHVLNHGNLLWRDWVASQGGAGTALRWLGRGAECLDDMWRAYAAQQDPITSLAFAHIAGANGRALRCAGVPSRSLSPPGPDVLAKAVHHSGLCPVRSTIAMAALYGVTSPGMAAASQHVARALQQGGVPAVMAMAFCCGSHPKPLAGLCALALGRPTQVVMCAGVAVLIGQVLPSDSWQRVPWIGHAVAELAAAGLHAGTTHATAEWLTRHGLHPAARVVLPRRHCYVRLSPSAWRLVVMLCNRDLMAAVAASRAGSPGKASRDADMDSFYELVAPWLPGVVLCGLRWLPSCRDVQRVFECSAGAEELQGARVASCSHAVDNPLDMGARRMAWSAARVVPPAGSMHPSKHAPLGQWPDGGPGMQHGDGAAAATAEQARHRGRPQWVRDFVLVGDIIGHTYWGWCDMRQTTRRHNTRKALVGTAAPRPFQRVSAAVASLPAIEFAHASHPCDPSSYLHWRAAARGCEDGPWGFYAAHEARFAMALAMPFVLPGHEDDRMAVLRLLAREGSANARAAVTKWAPKRRGTRPVVTMERLRSMMAVMDHLLRTHYAATDAATNA